MLEKSTQHLVVFTGGGTTGHVTKNKILIEALKKSHPEVKAHYLGLRTGKEAELITPELAKFHPIASGKLRRYFSLQTIPDFFKFFWGIWQSYWLLRKLRPNLVFSSGGYVAMPVCIAAWMRKISIITHETDSYPGLSNRIIGRVAKRVLLGFESARAYFKPSVILRAPKGPKESPKAIRSVQGDSFASLRSAQNDKVVFTGNPVSPELFEGSRERALKKLGFSAERKVLLVMGGSQGAQEINELALEILPALLKGWQVIHLVGAGKGGRVPKGSSYRAFSYVTAEYIDFLTAADLVITRGGGNSLAEVAALGKPAIVIPLGSAAGNHQYVNAIEMSKDHPHWRMLVKPSAEELFKVIGSFSSRKTEPFSNSSERRSLSPTHNQISSRSLNGGIGKNALEKIVEVVEEELFRSEKGVA